MFTIKITEPHRELRLEVREEPDSESEVTIESPNESGLSRSSKFRTRLVRAVKALYTEFRDQMRVYVRAILHNTGTTELLIRQTIERYTRKIPYSALHQERIDAFTAIIAADPKKFAEDLLSLEQRAVDLDAQLLGMNVLIGKRFDQSVDDHNLRALLRRCMQPFIEILKEHSINIDFVGLDTKTIRTDFRLFNCAMYHFFDNVQKYIQPGSRLIISVSNDNEELLFKMTSRALEDHEKTAIFNESYSGRNSGSQKGEGFGMYIFKKVLNKMNAEPAVTWKNNSHPFMFEGHTYREQTFSVKFSDATVN